MCGIAGFRGFNLGSQAVNGILSSMHHRGPDEQNFYQNQDVILLHTRLAIVDLTHGGSQPKSFRGLTIVFNGEIYNYKEIRDEMVKAGYSFETKSDSEVILKSFHCWGEKCLDKFIGMFSFVIYDEQEESFFVARDRLGVKPLYYFHENQRFGFASELKALRMYTRVSSISIKALYFYFRFGYVPSDLSIWEGIQKLEPGHFLQVSKAGLRKTRYWKVPETRREDLNENEWADRLEEIMISAFNYRMVSDVPVGIFLSGGKDSSLLAAILQKANQNINAFTIGFEDYEFDESGQAKKIAAYLDLQHHHRILRLDDGKKTLESFYNIYDEPFADSSGIATASVARLVREAGLKVVMSADGGDELFGGYDRYIDAESHHKLWKNLPEWTGRLLQTGNASWMPLNLNHKIKKAGELIASADQFEFYENFIANQTNHELARLIGNEFVGYLGKKKKLDFTIHERMHWDLMYYLPDNLLVKVDRATMYYGVECREPLLDHRLVELVAQMPADMKVRGGQKKYILQKILDRYFPPGFFDNKKRGFNIPLFKWFNADLDFLFDVYFSTPSVSNLPIINTTELHLEWRRYRKNKRLGKGYNIEKMWRLLSFAMWWKHHGTS